MPRLSQNPEPGLFGLRNSNKDFRDSSSWGKNQFANAFPASLACYMGAEGIPLIHLRMDSQKDVQKGYIETSDFFGLKELSPSLHFAFETQFTPYAPFVVGKFDNIDLVTFDTANEPRPLMGLEIKLTAIPDYATSNAQLAEQGAEMVVRPQTIYYLALRIADIYRNRRHELKGKLDSVCNSIADWREPEHVSPKLNELIQALDEVLIEELDRQKPFVLQPIWRTIGTSTELNEDCFDVFVWTDFAFTRLFVNTASTTSTNRVRRTARTVIWLAKMLHEFAKSGKFNPTTVKDTIILGTGNDKAFAVNGRITNQFLTCDELVKPRVKKQAVKEIILGGAQNYLRPERRLDAAILMTPGLFD